MAKRKSRKNTRNRQKKANTSKPILWDNLMIQFIIILLILLTLAFGAAYYAPSLIEDQTTDNNIAGGAITNAPSFVDNANSIASQIECNDGLDNDNDGLSDLNDYQCKNSWDTSESTF